MLDEFLLDSAEALAEADAAELLPSTAGAGGRVRSAARASEEAGVLALRPEGRPRTLLLAGPPGTAAALARFLDALGNGSAPVIRLTAGSETADPASFRWTLPGWAGPVDLLVLVTPNGTEPGLCGLAEQAYRRGCTVVAVAPEHSPLADVLGDRGLLVPYVSAPGTAPAALRSPAEQAPEPDASKAAPGTLWALAAPLFLLADRLGLAAAPPSAVESLAERLDTVAGACGPAVSQHDNPAKTFALELDGTAPLLWSHGPAADAAAAHWTQSLAALPGIPSLTGRLPESLASQAPVLRSASTSEDDFFRDRVTEPEPVRSRLVLLHEVGETEAGPPPVLLAARQLAIERGTSVSELAPTADLGPLQTLGELIATADFTTVYLTLAGGSAP